MATCTVCGKPAVFRTAEGALCKDHFAKYFERIVFSTIDRYKMIQQGDRICVGFSGGKDSTVLLSTLAKLPYEVELIAVTVDEGIGGYRDDTIAEAKRTVERLGVEHRIVTFHNLCGKTLDELLQTDASGACSVCGTLRRRALNQAARDFDADKIATGHCLDDEAQSIVMNYLRGDFTRITGQFNTNSSDLFTPRIKPLCRLTEREVVAYGLACKLLNSLPECPYTQYALRKDVRTWLGKLEHAHAGTLLRIANGQENLRVILPQTNEPMTELHRCEICGEPTGNRICSACKKLEDVLKR